MSEHPVVLSCHALGKRFVEGPNVVEVLDRLGHVTAGLREGVSEWIDPVIRNAAGLEVGEHHLEPIEL